MFCYCWIEYIGHTLFTPVSDNGGQFSRKRVTEIDMLGDLTETSSPVASCYKHDGVLPGIIGRDRKFCSVVLPDTHRFLAHERGSDTAP